MIKTVVIDKNKCIGCESCIEICPEIFEFDEKDEKAFVRLAEGGDEECIEEAITACPAECIYWEN
jgi:ferredoxin